MFDTITDRDTRATWILIADASSKGALGITHSDILRDEFRNAVGDGCMPAKIVERLNNVRFDVADRDLQVTIASALVARISSNGHELCYSSAGHDIGLLFTGRAHRHLAPTGPILGILPDYRYTETTLHLESGTLLVLATDGVTEARACADPSHQFGTSGLARAVAELRAHGNVSAESVHQRVDAFTNNRYSDDATLAIIHLPVVRAPRHRLGPVVTRRLSRALL